VVDGQVIGESDVAAALEDWNTFVRASILAQQPNATSEDLAAQMAQPAAVLNRLVAAPTILEVVGEAGAGVSEAQALDTWSALGQQLGFDASAELSDASLLYLRSQIAIESLNAVENAQELQEEIGTRLAELDVTVSERYGTWTEQGLVQSTWDWIETPGPEVA
jgi:hypothetical protein